MKKFCLGLALAGSLVSSSTVSAKTLALWPLCDNKESPAVITYNATGDTRFDLTGLGASFNAETPGGWNLPPNQDLDVDRQIAVQGSVESLDDAGTKSGVIYGSGAALGRYMSPTNDFTVEGWIKFTAFDTAKSSWRIIFQGGGGTGSHGGYSISVRYKAETDEFFLNFFAANLISAPIPSSGDKSVYNFLDGSSAVKSADLVGSWHHYALTFKHKGAGETASRYRLYVDGNLRLTYDPPVIAPEQLLPKYTSNRFDLGGRTDTAGQRVCGLYSYWRLSDQALEPDGFLNAGGTGSAVDPDPIVETTVLGLSTAKTGSYTYSSMGTQIKNAPATSNFTFEVWICPRDYTTHAVLCQFSGGDYRSNWTLSKQDDGMLHQVYSMNSPISKAWISAVSERPVPVNRWSHVAFVFDGDEWKFYLNGQLDNSTSGFWGHHLMPDDSVMIGNQREWSSPNSSCNALYSEARVWDRARTAEEIAANYRKRLAAPWNEPHLIGYMPLDDGEAGEAANGQCARNCASFDTVAACKYAAYMYRHVQAFVTNGLWETTTGLDLSSAAPTNCAVVRFDKLPNIQTNSVDTGVKAVPEKFTLTGWYMLGRRGNTSGDENCIFSKAHSGNGRMHLREQNGNLSLWIGGGTGGATNEDFLVDVASDFPVGKWTHLAFVRDGQVIRVYLNGKKVVDRGGFTLPFLPGPTYQVGGFNAGGSWGGFTGLICEVGIWKTVLTEEQIAQAMTCRPKGTEKHLLGYWPMDDGAGDELRNLKTGGAPAKPVEKIGHFDWSILCADRAPNDGTMVFPPPPGLRLMLK